MATPPREDGSDHEDHGSVITYRDEEDDHPIHTITSRPLTTPPPQKPQGTGSRWFEFRAMLADLCDCTPWEATFVLLGVAFLCLTIAEVSIFVGPIGTQQGLEGMSAISAALLSAMVFEIICKSAAYDLGFWRVPRNALESISIIVAFATQIAATVLIFSKPGSFVTFQLVVASRVLRLVVCVLRQRRSREFLVAIRAIRSLNDESLTTQERTMQILREVKTKYPLSDVHQVQLQWCVNVIASHRLYSGLSRGPNGEPIQFTGVDEDTSKWLVHTYTQARGENAPASSATFNVGSKQNTPPKELDHKRNNSPILGTNASDKPGSPPLSASAPNVLRAPDGKLSRVLSRRDTDGSDALLSGRRHTPLYLPSDKASMSLQEVGVEDKAVGGPVLTNSPSFAHKRSLSRANILGRQGDQSQSARKGSTLRRGSSFANPIEPIVDLEEGLAFGGQLVNQTRVLTGASLGLVPGDVDFIFNSLREDVDTSTGQRLKEMLDRVNREIDDWNFDVFTLDDWSGGYPLTPCLLSTLRKNNVFDALGQCISLPVVINFCLEIERGYNTTNPYHNRIHAADVVQCFHHFLTHRQFKDSITPLDRFLGLIAAAVHDFKHPGLNNAFLINTRNAIAVQYNDIAVLENMHVACAFEIMRAKPDLDILAGLPPAARAEARETIIQMVLATDMKAHFDILSQFKNQIAQAQVVEKTHENLGAWWHELFPVERDVSFSSTASSSGPLTAYPLDYRRVIMKTALHVADVSNPARPNVLTVRWADLVQEEFFRQGDQERTAGIQISMFMDRTKPAFPKMQVGFIEFIVKPLVETYGGWLRSLRPIVEPHLTANLEYWKKRQEAETNAAVAPSTGATTANVAQPTTPVHLSSSVDNTKAASKLVVRLITGSGKHRATGSVGELNFGSTVDSPSQQSLKRPAAIRRTTSETIKPSGSPAVTGDPAAKRPAGEDAVSALLRSVSSPNVQGALASPASNDSDTTNLTG